MKPIKERLTVKTDNYYRAVTVFMAMLGAALVAVLTASGTASAEEKENGLIYYRSGGWVYNVDPATGFRYPGTSVAQTDSWGFDISPDRQDLVYAKCYFGGCYNSLYIFPLSGGDPDFDESEVPITNKSSSVKLVENPRFSHDGKTIYFIGVHFVDPPEGVNDPSYDTGAIYSVPTEGGEAKKVDINLLNDDGTNRGIYGFALSHDGKKFALEGDHGVFTVPVSGGDATRVSNDSCNGTGNPNQVGDPNFSPDDQTIVYMSRIWSGANCSGTWHNTIYTTPANNDGTSPGTALFPKDATDATDTRYKEYPSYSPDGKFIVFNERQNGDRSHYLSTAPATDLAPGTDRVTKKLTYSSYSYPLWVEKNPPPSPLPQTRIDYEDWQSYYPDEFPYYYYFSSSDEAAEFECRLDAGAWEACTSPKDYYDVEPSQGKHIFQVRATNSAGTDPTPASDTWIWDTIPPDTSITKGPEEGSTVDTNSATFEFSANESADFECRLDGTDWSDCYSPKKYTGLSNGTHTFEVRAVDQAYNYDDSPASRTWTVDNPDAPPNDNFADAQTISDGSSSIEGTTKGATRESGEPDHYTTNPDDAGWWVGDHSVWYRWTAPKDGKVTFDTCDSGTVLDSVLAVYTGSSLSNLTRVTDNNNGSCGGDWGAKVSFGAVADTTYYIAVSDVGGLRESTFNLNHTTEADTTAPTVDEASLNPSKLQTGVQRNADVTASFSEEIKLATLVTTPKDPADSTVGTSSNVKLERYNKKKKKWQPVSGVEVSCNTPCDTVTLDPFGDSTTNLLAKTKHRVTITTGVKDKADNALAQNYSWTFTTGES